MEVLEKIRTAAIYSPEIQKFDVNIRNFLLKFKNTDIVQISNSKQAAIIRKQITQINLQKLQTSLSLLPTQSKIIGLSVLREEEFSLILVIVPKGMQFRFHDHPKMIGKTRCVSGKFRITSLDPHFLVRIQENPNFVSKKYAYPKKHIKQQIIQAKHNCTTRIYPDKFNIHRIQALEDSCFLDLLIPDYPENCCHSYQIVEEDEQNIIIKNIGEPTEDIIDMNVILADKKQPIKSYADLFDITSSDKQSS